MKMGRLPSVYPSACFKSCLFLERASQVHMTAAFVPLKIGPPGNLLLKVRLSHFHDRDCDRLVPWSCPNMAVLLGCDQ